jgi:hypothetical protein
MKLRITALLITLPAVVAGLMVAVSTEASAASHSTRMTTRYVAIGSSGVGKVYMRCTTSSTCRGTIYFNGSYAKRQSFSVAGHSSKYVKVVLGSGDAADPFTHGVKVGDDYFKAVNGVRLYVNENSPRNITTYNWVNTETLVSSTAPKITGQIITPAPGHMTGLKVELIRSIRGGNTQVVGTRYVTEGGNYSFTSRLGTNNSSGSPYKLRISGIDDNGQFRSWFWRGSDGNTVGGGRYLADGSTVRTSKYGPFNADFHYSSITGTTTNGASVTVAAPPATFSSNAVTRRELDYPSCANVYGRDTSNGTYRVDFLPVDNGTAEKKYMVAAKSGSTQVWAGANGTGPFGSCQDVLNYQFSRSSLIPVNTTSTYDRDVSIRLSGNDLRVVPSFSGFTPTTSDKWVRLREYIPGVKILDAPVVAEGISSGSKTFHNVPPGKYWVEVGRRTGCSAWYPSRYPDNNAYFSGADRGAERWKTVAGKYPEYKKSYQMGYVARTPPSGYRGWMYRDYCKAYGVGTINTESRISGYDGSWTKSTSTNTKGAVVRGHVTRSGGRTNKEMMVRLSSTDGKRVIRTDYTDSSGNFYIAGLPSGSWTISVNSDSWRGIGRTFTGKHSISVSRGHSYTAGTLKFLS